MSDIEIEYIEVPWDTPPSSPVNSPRALQQLAEAIQKVLVMEEPKKAPAKQPPQEAPAKRNRRVHTAL